MVERAYGHLKGRFRILLTESTEALESLHVTVMVCIVLHNICVLAGDDTEIEEPFDDDDDAYEVPDDDNDFMSADELGGELVRDVISDNLDKL